MYETPELNVVEFDTEDAIRTSGNDWDNDVTKPTI